MAYVLTCVVLVKFIRDVESRNELFLALVLVFSLGIILAIILFLLYSINVNIEIELVIKDYTASTATTNASYIF